MPKTRQNAYNASFKLYTFAAYKPAYLWKKKKKRFKQNLVDAAYKQVNSIDQNLRYTCVHMHMHKYVQ